MKRPLNVAFLFIKKNTKLIYFINHRVITFYNTSQQRLLQ